MSRSKIIDRQIAALKAASGKKVEAGWFSSDRYGAEEGSLVGRSVSEVARLNEYGGTILHPGGTKYITDAIVKKRFVGSRFVSNSFQGEHKVTGPHSITIPARPFMRFAAMNFSRDRVKIQKSIAGKLASGKMNSDQALGAIGLVMESYIAKSIKNGPWKPNSASTIAKKGSSKPLIDSAHMLKTVNSKVS
jgi:hypothetical protein